MSLSPEPPHEASFFRLPELHRPVSHSLKSMRSLISLLFGRNVPAYTHFDSRPERDSSNLSKHGSPRRSSRRHRHRRTVTNYYYCCCHTSGCKLVDQALAPIERPAGRTELPGGGRAEVSTSPAVQCSTIREGVTGPPYI